MTKKNLGSRVTGNFLECEFLYCLFYFIKKCVLFLKSGEKTIREKAFFLKKVIYLSVILFTQFMFSNFRLKINLERKLQLQRKGNRVTNPNLISFLKFEVTDIIREKEKYNCVLFARQSFIHLIFKATYKMKLFQFQMRKQRLLEIK